MKELNDTRAFVSTLKFPAYVHSYANFLTHIYAFMYICNSMYTRNFF